MLFRSGAQDSTGAKSSIKKVMVLTITIISCTLLTLNWYAPYFIGSLSPSQEVAQFALPLLRIMSTLVVFDFVQLILAGALRGAGSVQTVMWGRFLSCMLFFVPASFMISAQTFSSASYKFGLIYGSFYINTALMGGIFLYQIKRKNWYKKEL